MKLGNSTAAALRSQDFENMVKDLPIGVMFCDINDDFRITYANKFTLETLRSIEHLLPCRASEIVAAVRGYLSQKSLPSTSDVV